MTSQVNFTSESQTEISVPPAPDIDLPSPFELAASRGNSELMTVGLLFLLGLGGYWLTRKPKSRQASAPTPAESHLGLTQRATATQWLGWAKDLEAAKQPEAALQMFKRGLQQHPQDFWLWYQQGLFLARLKRFEEAILSYDQAQQIRPHHGDLAHTRGDTLLELERYPEAVASLDIALDYSPNSGHLLTDRAYALYKSGQYTDALATIGQALNWFKSDGGPDLLRARAYQIDCYLALGQTAKALAAAQAAKAAHPDANFAELVASLSHPV